MGNELIKSELNKITGARVHKSLFHVSRSPYYIATPDYRYSSAGIRVLHYLCHALNESGEEAYVHCEATNPRLRTPLLTDEIRNQHAKTGRIPIAVYPEVVYGNPYKAPVVARYLLNAPGHLGGDYSYDQSELLFSYLPYYVPESMVAEPFYFPATDINIFNNIDNPDDHCRQGIYFYALKYLAKGGKLTEEANGAVNLAQLAQRERLTPPQLAALLRRAELLYCYEPSQIIIEANLCGCPVAYVPTDYLKENPAKNLFGDNGAVFGTTPDAIAKAKATVSKVWEQHLALIDQAWVDLDRFVEITQTAASQRSAPILLANTQTAPLAPASHAPVAAVSHPIFSIIICSIDDERFAKVAQNYRDLLTAIPHEIIRIADATSLCEGYNRGISRSQGDYLILSHDDIAIWTPDFGQRLLRHLDHCDLVGVAGTDLLVNAEGGPARYWTWGTAGPGHLFGRITTADKNTHKYYTSLFGVSAALVEGIQAVDGVFMALRRSVVETLRFDEETFDGFHLYDVDFSYRVFQSGFRVGVFNDITLVHDSIGTYDETWLKYHQRFLAKFTGTLPRKAALKSWKPAVIEFEQPDEVVTFYEDTLTALSATVSTTSKPAIADSVYKDACLTQASYKRWCERRQVGEGWAELVAERMVKQWTQQPTFHIVVWCEPGQQTALADTLAAIAQQWYARWGLSVLAPFTCPDPSFSELSNLEWIKVDANPDTALRQAVADSALDWFVLLEPGDRLPPQALLKAADYINRFPAWRLIYVDEDQLNARSERGDPLFRPDFDPELLLATHYLGDCCLMHRDSVLGSDEDLSYLPGLTTFQAALRVLARYGRTAIGHIADVLYHRSLARLSAVDPKAVAQARRQLIEDYLRRQGVNVAIEEALLPGSWRMIYQHEHQPKVSIIILAKDALDRLDRCLRRVLGETVYPDYEVIVVDCGSVVDDTLDLYAELQNRYPQRFQVIQAKGSFSIAAYWNQGAHQAQGEVLVFLSGSALVAQPQWLERLLNHALRPDVGVVGARMTTPDVAAPFVHGTAQVLGVHGIAGPLFSGLALQAPGPVGRAQVDQTVSAVSADCLAIRRDVFTALAGFDQAFMVAHADTDLCLRAAQHGYRTVWTPFANLAWLGDYPLAAALSHDQIVQYSRADADQMLERWLPRLGTDPAYNPNLSLAEPNRLELDLTPGWDVTFHSRPRILGLPVDESGCGLYRVYAPLWLLEHQARAECTLLKPGTRLPELAELERLAPDTIFYQTTLSDLQLEAMRRYRRFHQSFKVFDLDDLKHEVPTANSLKERLMRDMKYRHRVALEQCDRLIVSTEPLAEACRRWSSDIRVVPNRLEQARWGHLHNQRRAGPKPRVGWAGAQQHHGDLAFIAEVVKETHAEIDWVFFGMCLDELRPYVKEVHDWVHLNDYPVRLASLNLDLAVAPLELHPFNEAKSNLRILEHGILGRPMICTDIYPYRNAPVCRVANDTQAWLTAIRERVHDLDAAEKEGDALRAWVLKHYMLDDHTDEWLNALRP
jgi:GT2 family glycosyltransferase